MNLPEHRMGMHFIPVHQRNSDWQYMADLKPSVVKLVDPDPNEVRRCYERIDSNGFVWLRDHPLSEQKQDAMDRPAQTGIRHANEWADKLFNGRFKDVFDYDRIIVSGINEPYVRSSEEEKACFDYNYALLKRATELGFRVAALNLSVGWPRNLGFDMPPFWEQFFPLESVINEGNHFLCVHEYWYADPDESWFQEVIPNFGWLSHRVNYCPLQVPIIIGECGMEKMVDIERMKREGMPNKGWIGNLSPSAYAEQLWRYADKVNPNVFSVLPFTTDWGSHDWDTQDTNAAHNDIVRLKHATKWPDNYPVEPIHRSDYVDEPPIIIVPDEPDETEINVVAPYAYEKGRFVRGFGATLTHGGLDISMTTGTQLYAMTDGIVAWSGVDSSYGEYVRIFYPSLGFDSFYAHLGQRYVETGEEVKAGQLVGYSGNTGNSTGPHLHLEIRLKNMSVDNPTHSYATHSHFGRGRIDPLGILHLLDLYPFS